MKATAVKLDILEAPKLATRVEQKRDMQSSMLRITERMK
jgi:hypothetical protein